MEDFSTLFTEIDQTTKTNAKVAALVRYFEKADSADMLWAIAILSGNTPKRSIKLGNLKAWAAELAGLPMWLFEECYYIVGDLAETIALCLPPPTGQIELGLRETIHLLKGITARTDEEKKILICRHWMHIGALERFVFNKLMTGNFRMGLSKQLVIRALSIHFGMDEQMIAHSLMGKWDPDEEKLDRLFTEEPHTDRQYQPYPFYLAYPLEVDPSSLGDIHDWLVEKKYDGIRGQIIVRQHKLYIWSRGEELLTDKFPEFETLASVLPDGTVLDGEILPWKDGRPLPFQVMQTRISRKRISPKTLLDTPLAMLCYDLLELGGKDIRILEMRMRRKMLMDLLETYPTTGLLHLSPQLHFDNWDDLAVFRADARLHDCEGVMLKKWDSPYEAGRRRGKWWKWKTQALTIDGVLIYAQSGHGRRANLFTDYTFAVWDGDVLVPFAKAYSGLTDKEIAELDNWVKRHTVTKFGPVRSVHPLLVFEIAFEGIQRSSRHKSGVALRFPRILRWRRDKSVAEANHISDLRALIHVQA
ncbi:DNA ligase-1 [bacterium A37T11]|nr:DNA ligase-1 [bacterium A37T11]